MRETFTSDLSDTQIRAIARGDRFGDRTGTSTAATRGTCGCSPTVAGSASGAGSSSAYSAAPGSLAPGSPCMEVYELLVWFELRLTDHDIAQGVEVPSHRVHRFFLQLPTKSETPSVIRVT